MIRVKDFLKKYAVHKDYGRVFVDSAPARSKAMVDITVVQRGHGWNEAKEVYERYQQASIWHSDGSRTLRWGITHTDEYGTKDRVHINTLTQID